MSPLIWRLPAVLGLLCLSSTYVQSDKVRSFSYNTTFPVDSHNSARLIFDRDPLKNNTLLFADCKYAHYRSIDCTVTLSSYRTFEGVNKTDRCEVAYSAPSNARIGSDSLGDFQLKQLYSDQVILMWMEWFDSDSKLDRYQLVYRTIDMSSCKYVEHRMAFKTYLSVREVHVVPYRDSFELFFKNDSLCGDFMCVLTQDEKGRIVRGPVASHLPRQLFKHDTQEEERTVYSVKPESPELGHFVVSHSYFNLVSSNSSGVKHLMELPPSVESLAYSSGNGYLGICWKGHYDTYPDCAQFDSQGARTMRFSLDYEALLSSDNQASIDDSSFEKYRKRPDFHAWLAMSNLRDGSMLVLYKSHRWQVGDKLNVSRLRKVGRAGDEKIKVERIDGFSYADFDCGFSDDFKVEIHERENGDLCVSVACSARDYDKRERIIRLSAKCVGISESN